MAAKSHTANLELVTVAKATAWLNRNKSNRHLRPGVVEKYAQDMLAGKWTACAAPIVFYVDGDIADGQHRLWAIVESKKPQRFSVLRNFPREAALNIDTGVPRNLVDNARIAGIEDGLSLTLIAWSRAVEEGRRSTNPLSNAHKLALVQKHREAVSWVMQGAKLKGSLLRNSVTGAAMARACYAEPDKERLAHFGHVLSSGFSNGDEDSAGIAIRNYLLARRSVMQTSEWRDAFLKVQNAIWYFMRKRKLHVIKPIESESYPLDTRK